MRQGIGEETEIGQKHEGNNIGEKDHSKSNCVLNPESLVFVYKIS